MNTSLTACFVILAQAFTHCAALAADVMPVWQNDTAANALSFNDTFGHQVSIGTYNPTTGIFSVAAGSISVGATFTGGLLSIAGSPVTSSGTLALTVAGTSGGIPYFSGAATWASSSALAANRLVQGGGAGVAPSTFVLGGDCTLTSPNITCTKTNSVAFGTLATLNAAPAGTLTGATLASNVLASSLTSVGVLTGLTVSGIISNSGGAGYVTTVIDNSSDFTNGILVTGASTTANQELTQSPVTVKWHPGFTGSPGGTFNTAGLSVITTSTINDEVYPWGIIGEVLNFTDMNTNGNPNAVAVAGSVFTQNVASSQASSSWGATFNTNETQATAVVNPSAYRIGAEIGVAEPAGASTDTNAKRNGVLVAMSSADATTHHFSGIDIYSSGGGIIDNGIVFYKQGNTGTISTLINQSNATCTNFLSGAGGLYGVDCSGNENVVSLLVNAATGGNEGSGTINISGAYYDNGTVGVTCATGSPTSSFSAKGGIVTHC